MSALGHKRTHAAQQKGRYSITSSGRCCRINGTGRPSALFVREVARPKIICHHAFCLPQTGMSFLTTSSLWIAAVVLLIPTTIFAMCGPVIVRRYIPLEQLRSNNEVAGFKFAAIGVFYAVLLGFAILVVWERFNKAYNEVANEASAAATVFKLTTGLDASHGAAVRKAQPII